MPTVKEQYDFLYGNGAVSEPLEDENWFSRGVKSTSRAIDRALEYTGLPGLTEQFGREFGSIFGAPEEGAYIGRKLPRSAVNFAPMMLATTGVGAPLGIAATAALSGAEAYEETDSPAAGLIGAVTNIAMPGISRLVGQQALKRLGGELVQGPVLRGGVDRLQQLASGVAPTMIREYIPKTLGQGLGAEAIEQAAGSAVGFVGGQAESLFSGRPYEFSPTTELLNMTLGQLPFAALSATKKGRVMFGGDAARQHAEELRTSVKLTEDAIEQHRLNEEVSGKAPVDKIPDTPEEIAARELRVTKLSDLRERQRAAKADGTTVAEEERQKWSNEDNAILREQGVLPGYILGVPREAIPKRPILDPTAPSEDPVIKLTTAEQRLAAARDNVDLQDSIVEVNEVRERYGMIPLDDVEIVARQRRFSLGSDRDSIQSHIDETRRLATAREEGRALNVEIKLKAAELEHPDPMVRAMATQRLAEIAAESKTLENAKHIANAPLTRDSAPIKGFMHEQAVKITESVPETNLGDQQKFLDWTQGGATALMQKHGMDLDAAAEFLNDNPTVLSWTNRLEMQIRNGLELTDYAQRHLMNQGVREAEAAQKAAIVAELSAPPPLGELRPSLVDRLLAVPTEGAETKKAAAEMNELLANDPETTHSQFAEKQVANADELYNQFVKTGQIDEDALIVLDDKVTDYIYAKAREHHQLADVMKSAEDTKFVNSPSESPDSVLKALQKITDAQNKYNELVAETAGVAGVAPKTYLEDILTGSKAPSQIARRISAHPDSWDIVAGPLESIEGGWQRFKDAWKLPSWLARVSPHMAEFVAKGHQLSPNIRKMAMESQKAFGMDEKGNFNKELLKALEDRQITGALSKWIGINNRRGSKKDAEGNSPGVVAIRADDPEVAKVLQGLPEDKQAMVRELMMRQVISTKTMQQQELGKMREIYAVEGTQFLGPRTGLKYDQNLKLSNDMLDLLQVDWNDPTQAMKGQEMMTKLQTQFADRPEVYTELYRTMGEKMLEYQQRKEFFDKNPAWATEHTYGKWIFKYRKGKREVLDTANSRGEAKEIAAGNEITYWDRNLDHDDTPVNYDRDIPVEQADAQWFRNHTKWLDKNATFWSRKLYRTQAAALLADPELAQRPDILRQAKQHADNMLSPDPTTAMAINRFASTWFLGWNAASAMANGTQLIVRGAAEMTKLTGKPIESYRRITNAYKEMFNPAGMGDEHKKIVQRLERDGITSGIDDQFITGDEDSGAALKRALGGRAPLKDATKNLSRTYQNIGMKMFRAMEKKNNVGAVLAAFDYYRGQKDVNGRQLSFEDAYERALVFNRSVNDVGGKANRPIDIMSGTGPISKSLGLLATSLQTYNLGTIGQIASYVKNGFFDQPGMTPAQKWNNKVALGQLLVVQAGLAGAMGMPGMAAAMALAHQVWPSMELEKKFRGGINAIVGQFLNDDEEDGGIIADIALTGIPSTFGWDIQSRLSMGNPFMTVSEINGFQPELMSGAPVNMVQKFLKGGLQAAQGDLSYVGNMMPPALKKLWDATTRAKILDYNGKPILEQPTVGERVGLALGFQPTLVSDFNKANRMKTRGEELRRNEDHRFNQQQASELNEKGNFGDIKQRLRERQIEAQERGETYDPTEGARKIARAAGSLYFPRDLRKELSPNDSALAKWYRLPLNKPTNVQRAQFYAQTLRGLGVPYKPRDMAKYALMDQIEAQNPGEYTDKELMQQAEKAMGKAKPVPELL